MKCQTYDSLWVNRHTQQLDDRIIYFVDSQYELCFWTKRLPKDAWLQGLPFTNINNSRTTRFFRRTIEMNSKLRVSKFIQ
jgi:hypothetical protein